MQYDLIANHVRKWQDLSSDLVEHLERCRPNGPDLDAHEYFQQAQRCVDPSQIFYHWSMQLGVICTRMSPPLSPTPMHDLALAVNAWYRDRNCDAVPTPSELDTLHRRCLMIAHTLEMDAIAHLEHGDVQAAPEARERETNAPRRPSENEERDNCLYVTYIDGTKKNADILKELKARGWFDLTTEPSISMTVNRAADRWGIDRPKRGQKKDDRRKAP